MGGAVTSISVVHINVRNDGVALIRLRIHGFDPALRVRPFRFRLGLPSVLGQPNGPLFLEPAAILDIGNQELTIGGARRGGFISPSGLLRRLWPFRWPAEEPAILLAAPPKEPELLPGAYLDLLF